jgi:transcriptional regulator with GAF, ATPase, and Fis domain
MPDEMMSYGRERRLGRVFVELADSLVDDFDVLDFLGVLVERSVELLRVSAAGVLLADQKGGLRMAAASSEQARLVELFAVQAGDGPCLDTYRTGQPTSSTDLATDTRRWPRFVPAAEAAGFHAVHALPMRLRRAVIGVLTFLNDQPDGVDSESVAVGQAFADVATIGILQHRAVEHAEVLTEQLQHALNSRVLIEQAKGVLATHAGIDVGQAFTRLRSYARSHGLRLTYVAGTVVDRTADLDALIGDEVRRAER